jgi:hydroxyacylglutathione hydrolase
LFQKAPHFFVVICRLNSMFVRLTTKSNNMKRIFSLALSMLIVICTHVQSQEPEYSEKEVFRNFDVVFRQIDDHTWVGSGNRVSYESLYLVEGKDRAILIDAGTDIKDLKKIVEGITTKPITLVATHVHGDHTGASIKYFDEIYINAADMVNVPFEMPDYKGNIRYLTDGEIIDLGGRKIEVIFTPGHTPGSTTFIDKTAGYGFSGDAFGSSFLLLFTNFSTLKLTCQRMSEYMQKNNISKLYPGHYQNTNIETLQRVKDMNSISIGALSGEIKGTQGTGQTYGLGLVIEMYGVKINYNNSGLK